MFIHSQTVLKVDIHSRGRGGKHGHKIHFLKKRTKFINYKELNDNLSTE